MESKTGPLENDVMLTVVNPDESPEGSSKGTLLLYGFCDTSGHDLITGYSRDLELVSFSLGHPHILLLVEFSPQKLFFLVVYATSLNPCLLSQQDLLSLVRGRFLKEPIFSLVGTPPP